MFSKRLSGRTAEDEPARGKRDHRGRMPSPSPATAPDSRERRAGALPLQGRQTRRQAECVWAERSPRPAAAGSVEGNGHLSRRLRSFMNGGATAEKSDCQARASLVSIPETRGTRLGPIGVSPNIVVTIAALGDPCLQS
jgi:hypothetical protein